MRTDPLLPFPFSLLPSGLKLRLLGGRDLAFSPLILNGILYIGDGMEIMLMHKIANLFIGSDSCVLDSSPSQRHEASGMFSDLLFVLQEKLPLLNSTFQATENRSSIPENFKSALHSRHLLPLLWNF